MLHEMDGPERNVNVCKMTQENFNASPSTSIIRWGSNFVSRLSTTAQFQIKTQPSKIL